MNVYADRVPVHQFQSVGNGLSRPLVDKSSYYIPDNRLKGIVQQKPINAKPVIQQQAKVNINDDKGLETEADLMGTRALNLSRVTADRGSEKTSQFKIITPVSSGLILPNSNSPYQRAAYGDVNTGSASIIQLHDNRLVTDPFFQDSRKTVYYFAGWLMEIIDAFTMGNLYDGFSLLLGLMGNAEWYAKVEEAVRYLQHHPEVAGLLGVSLTPFLVSTFGIPVWAANIILTVLSRGAIADQIGDLAFSMLMSGPYSSLMTQYLIAGLKRRFGRSIINRGLVFAYNIGGGLASGLVSGVSWLLHGFSLSGGAHGNDGEQMPVASREFGDVYSMISQWLPIERLHIIPARRGGRIHDENAAYGAAATNSMMIPNEAAGHPATAIQGPAGMLEGMGMRSGLFMARGIRPREGFIEHAAAGVGLA